MPSHIKCLVLDYIGPVSERFSFGILTISGICSSEMTKTLLGVTERHIYLEPVLQVCSVMVMVILTTNCKSSGSANLCVCDFFEVKFMLLLVNDIL